jgi:ABC-2 type transport system ATP-binding protein
MTRPPTAIAAIGLRKSYGDHIVLEGIDLDVAEGTVFALLGPNGAGKTTIVQILSTLIEADAGALRIAGAAPPSCSNASTSSRRLAGRPRRTPAACDAGSTSR